MASLRRTAVILSAIFSLISLFAFSRSLQAAPMTFTVNSTLDAADNNPGNGTCDDGAGHCTLRAAIQEAFFNSGPDTINFSIGTGSQTISPSSALFNIGGPVTIDGTTQPGYSGTPLIEIDGANAGGGNGLNFATGSDNSAVKGLIIDNFTDYGIQITGASGFTIQGNYIGTDKTGLLDHGNGSAGIYIKGGSDHLIGGTTAAARNLISGNNEGIVIETTSALSADSTGNTVQGNYIGVDASGTSALGNTSGGIRITDSTNTTLGGTSAEARNIVSGNGEGIRVTSRFNGNPVQGTAIQGNYIGTDVTGMVDLGNGGPGIVLDLNRNTTIGGDTPLARNIISGNNGSGIRLQGLFPDPISEAGNMIQGNYIGTDATGLGDLGNSGTGIFLDNVSANNRIQQNVIAFNDLNGVAILDVFQNIGTSILGNSIFSNSNLGIDLNYSDGVSANDFKDVDSGANNTQNYPVVTGAILTNGNIMVAGSLNSLPSRSFLLQFFSNTSCDSSGHGEGETFLGESQVSTDGSGNVFFDLGTSGFSFPQVAGGFITATATEIDANDSSPHSTSEFSICATLAVCGDGVTSGLETCDDGNDDDGDCCNSHCQGDPDGTACGDGDDCTNGDACQSGICTPSSTVACSPLDQCHDAGVCDMNTGLCSNPLKPAGSPCDDQNAQTVDDVCDNVGVCAGSPPAPPPPVCGDGVCEGGENSTSCPDDCKTVGGSGNGGGGGGGDGGGGAGSDGGAGGCGLVTGAAASWNITLFLFSSLIVLGQRLNGRQRK